MKVIRNSQVNIRCVCVRAHAYVHAYVCSFTSGGSHTFIFWYFEGLFHRAIAESGSALADWAYLDSKAASEYASIVAADLNCDTTNTTVGSCLREAPVPSLLAASLNISLQVNSKCYHCKVMLL